MITDSHIHVVGPDTGTNPRESTSPENVDTREASINTLAGVHLIPKGALALDGWLEFNRIKWGYEPRRFQIGSWSENKPVIDATYYVDKKGNIHHPRRNPYLPIGFRSTPTTHPGKVTHQWLDHATLLVQEMLQHGLVNTMTLPPGILDIRPWTWAGFQVSVKYTYIIDFPFDFANTSKEFRRKIRRCESLGYRVERTTDMNLIHGCLAASEARQHYDLGLSAEDLELARKLIGDEHLQAYAAFAPNGDIAAASVSLVQPGTAAIGLFAGTHDAHLASGVTTLLDAKSIQDFETSGATGFDLCGANMPTIAAFKSSWGARLVPYYSVEEYSMRRFAKWSRNWWQFRMQRAKGG